MKKFFLETRQDVYFIWRGEDLMMHTTPKQKLKEALAEVGRVMGPGEYETEKVHIVTTHYATSERRKVKIK